MINITFTEKASSYLQHKLAGSQTKFRLSVKKTGCSGFSYFPKLVEELNSNDISVKVNDDLTIYIDSEWLELLSDLSVDYIEEDKSGLKQKRLVFTNPKESSRCGCGESFHIE